MDLTDGQAEILGTVRRLPNATVRDIWNDILKRKKLTYTTVGTTLDRLYRKGLLIRTRKIGPGGQTYIYSAGCNIDIQTDIIQSVLRRLITVFGLSIVPIIYESLSELADEERER